MRRRNLDERGGKVIGVDTDQTAQINAYGEDYKRLVSDIFEKKIEISDAIADVPAHSITLNQYPNIK